MDPKLSSGLMLANQNIVLKSESNPVIRISHVCPACSKVFAAFVVGTVLTHSLYGAERRAAPKLPVFCNWLKKKPNVSHFHVGSGILFVYTE